MRKRDLLLKIFLPFLILILAVGLTIVMVRSRKIPQQEDREFYGPLVKVMAVTTESREIFVMGTGSVQPSREVDITPQVSGQIVEIAPAMVVGGFFQKGDQLFKIEDVDYQLALESARANLAQAELERAKISGQAEIARMEWQRLDLKDNREPHPLVVFEPQMKSAEAQSAAARAAVEQAELNLRRTRLNAPFNCYVRAENVEIGQYVKSGSNVATVAGTDEIEIIVPLPLEELNWIRIPGQNGAGEVSSVDILLELGKQVYSWEGRVRRLLGDVDPKSRMAALVVTVADPFGTLGKRPSSGPQLAPGTFVQVLIKGKRLENVVVVPRLAVHDDDTVWLVDGQDKLLIRHVEIVRREREDVLVTSGLKSGDRVILTNLSGAADGMLLRPQEAGASR